MYGNKGTTGETGTTGGTMALNFRQNYQMKNFKEAFAS
jgi:hypothetical protein